MLGLGYVKKLFGTISAFYSTHNKSRSALDKNKRGYIKLDSDEEWDKFFDLQNDSDTNTTNKEPFSPKTRRISLSW